MSRLLYKLVTLEKGEDGKFVDRKARYIKGRLKARRELKAAEKASENDPDTKYRLDLLILGKKA